MESEARKAAGELGRYASSAGAGAATGLPRERSMGDVLKDIAGNFQEIVRSEVRLAKAEAKEEGRKSWGAGRMLLAGAVLGFYALGFILLGIERALALALVPWLAALIVGVALLVMTGVLISAGRARWSKLHPKLEKT